MVIAAATTSRNSSALGFPAKSRIADPSPLASGAAERFAPLGLFQCEALHTACVLPYPALITRERNYGPDRAADPMSM
jgi:hypothetical protein